MNQLTLKALSLNCTSSKSRKTMFYQIFLKGFQLFVIVFMIYIFHQCISRYCEQADNSTVDYQWYHQHEKDIYPTISACFSGSSVVFSEEKMKLLDSSLNAKLYSQFLEGKYWDDKMSEIEYDQVSILLLDHLDLIRIVKQDGTSEEWMNNKMLSMKDE